MDNMLNHLFTRWHMLKQKEHQYRQDRIRLEQEIEKYIKLRDQWKDTGTMKFDQFHIRRKFSRKWDQKKLLELKNQYFSDLTHFPFLEEYKEIVQHSWHLSVHKPHLWQKLRSALTIQPLKPYFFRSDHIL